MNTEMSNELGRIAEYQNSLLPRHEKMSEHAISKILATTISSYDNGTVDFRSFIRVNLAQSDKIRKVATYKPFSPEDLLCIYLKRLLDRKIHIKYPNRNVYVRTLFDATNALKDMPDYTILKFDFADYFNSVSSIYVYRKYIKHRSLERFQMELLDNFVSSTEYAYAGLNTSNILCEIVAQDFDRILVGKFAQRGIILYKRYVDDGIIILNRFITQADCQALVNDAIQEAFFTSIENGISPCKTCLNHAKTKYIAGRHLTVGGVAEYFDFLGYEFELSRKTPGRTEFRYGITQAKIDKYTEKVDTLIKEYLSDQHKDMELLRHRIKAFTHRTVYQIVRYKSAIWKNKGFIANYCELRHRMDLLIPATEKFLKNCVYQAFQKNNVPLPYFLKGNSDESIYSLYNNLKNYRTLVFVEIIGFDLKSVKKMCKQIGIDIHSGKGYDGFVRDYLIRVKVGH